MNNNLQFISRVSYLILFLFMSSINIFAQSPVMIDVWDSSDPNNFILVGQIQAIQTAQTGAAHYSYSNASGHPSCVNVATDVSNLWMHENTTNGDLTFGFIFEKQNRGGNTNNALLNFRIVNSDTDPFVSLSDDPGEAVETGTSNAFVGTYVYLPCCSDGIAVSGISGGEWTVIIDAVDFGSVTDWLAAGGTCDFDDDLVLILGSEYRLTPAGNPPSGAPVQSGPLFVDAGPDKEVICTESVEIGGAPTALDGEPDYTYLWSPADGLDDTTISNPTASPLTTTIYTVTVTDADGTVLSDDVTVTVIDNEAPEIVCPSNTILEINTSSIATYAGPPASASDNCDADPVVTSVPELPVNYDTPGDYVITWTATDASGNSTSCDQTITVAESYLHKKSETLPALATLISGEKKIDDKLEKAIEKIEKSLNPEYWLDEYHLVDKKGKKVFDEEKKAVKELKKILKDKKADEGIKLAVAPVIDCLVAVDKALATLAIEEAEAACLTDKCAKEIEKANKEMLKAEEEIAKGHPDHAIDKYKKAWEHAGHAVKHNLPKQWNGDTQDIASDIPSEYGLNQNYPNPFNPSTTISFNLPEAASIRIIVYNTLGEQIELLADGIYSAGYHSVQFNADNLNTGLYLYKLETDNFVSVKKMVLVK